jgi:hypothetical protein
MDTMVAQPQGGIWPVYVPHWPTTAPIPVSTRGLSPSDFPGGPIDAAAAPASGEPTQPPTATSAESLLTDADRSALRAALDVLRTFPDGRTTNGADKQRLATTIAYTTGYLEAKGVIQPPSLLGILIANAEPARSDLATSYNTLLQSLNELINATQARAVNWRNVAHIVGGVLVAVGTALQSV